jgi:hypothetical protein
MPTRKSDDKEEINRRRTQKATLTNIRRGEERKADELADQGWTVISPYDGSVRGPAPKIKDE